MFDFEKINCAEKTTVLSLALNLVIFLIKIVSAYFSKSRAMLAESMHTLADIAVTAAVFIGIIFSSKAENESRHMRAREIEQNLSRMLATVLIITAFCIALSGIKVIINGNHVIPTKAAVVAIILSAVIKEIMYRYTLKASQATGNNALKADAWHHRSDALSSLASLTGILGARMGVTLLDPLASLIVSVMIMKTAIDIYKSAGETDDKEVTKPYKETE